MAKAKRPSRYAEHDDGSPTAQEDRVARRLGGKRVRGSGASIYSKGDVRDVAMECVGDEDDVQFLVECKQTIHASLSVKWVWLMKISKEAVQVGKEPALAMEIQGGPDCPLTDRDWVAVPARVFEKLAGKTG